MSAAEETESPSAVEDRFLLVGTVLENKYTILKTVAEGGFGVVYKGIQTALGRNVAIKVLKTPPELNAAAARDFQEKFTNEARTVAQHSHANIVQVIDFGVSAMPSQEVAPWMVLEWLTGKTLEDSIVDRKRPYSPKETMTLMRPVLEALAYVHEAGIAHRDLKPANIMVVETGKTKQPKLMDFGIAKLMDPAEQAGSGATRTRSSQNAFSPQYASPEQLSGTRSGPWTDVHAMGLIITEMLTGQVAFNAEDMTGLFVQILGERRPTPAKVGVDVGAWESVLAKAVAIKPDDRFHNAAELLAAMEENIPSSVSGVDETGARTVVPNSPTTMRQSAVQVPIPLTNSKPAKSNTGLIVAVVGAALFLGGGAVAYKLRGGDTANANNGGIHTATSNGTGTTGVANTNGNGTGTTNNGTVNANANGTGTPNTNGTNGAVGANTQQNSVPTQNTAGTTGANPTNGTAGTAANNGTPTAGQNVAGATDPVGPALRPNGNPRGNGRPRNGGPRNNGGARNGHGGNGSSHTGSGTVVVPVE